MYVCREGGGHVWVSVKLTMTFESWSFHTKKSKGRGKGCISYFSYLQNILSFEIPYWLTLLVELDHCVLHLGALTVTNSRCTEGLEPVTVNGCPIVLGPLQDGGGNLVGVSIGSPCRTVESVLGQALRFFLGGGGRCMRGCGKMRIQRDCGKCT